MDAQFDVSGVTCDANCTKPCSAFREFVLTPSRTIRIYRHPNDFWTTYVFTPCDGASWTGSGETCRHFTLEADNGTTSPLLVVDLENVMFDSTLRKDGRGLQLLVDGEHIFWNRKNPNEPTEVRFEAVRDPYAPPTVPGQPGHHVVPPLKNHFDNLIMGFLSLIILFHLFNTQQHHLNDLFKYYDTVCMTTIQCCASVLFQWIHCLVFPRPSLFHEVLLDFLTLVFLSSNGMAAYLASVMVYQDWLVMTLQQISFWVCVKTCVERIITVLNQH